MRSALADLELDHLYVVHAGTHRFVLDERITAIGAAELLTDNDLSDEAAARGAPCSRPRGATLPDPS